MNMSLYLLKYALFIKLILKGICKLLFKKNSSLLVC